MMICRRQLCSCLDVHIGQIFPQNKKSFFFWEKKIPFFSFFFGGPRKKEKKTKKKSFFFRRNHRPHRQLSQDRVFIRTSAMRPKRSIVRACWRMLRTARRASCGRHARAFQPLSRLVVMQGSEGSFSRRLFSASFAALSLGVNRDLVFLQAGLNVI